MALMVFFVLERQARDIECIFLKNYPSAALQKKAQNAKSENAADRICTFVRDRNNLARAAYKALGMDTLSTFSQGANSSDQHNFINYKPGVKLHTAQGVLWPVYMIERKGTLIFGCVPVVDHCENDSQTPFINCPFMGECLEILSEIGIFFVNQLSQTSPAATKQESTQSKSVCSNQLLSQLKVFLNVHCPHGQILVNHNHLSKLIMSQSAGRNVLPTSLPSDSLAKQPLIPSWRLNISSASRQTVKVPEIVVKLMEKMDATIYQGPLGDYVESRCYGAVTLHAQLPSNNPEVKLRVTIPMDVKEFADLAPTTFNDNESGRDADNVKSHVSTPTLRTLHSYVHHPLVFYSDYGSTNARNSVQFLATSTPDSSKGNNPRSSVAVRGKSFFYDGSYTYIDLRCFVSSEPFELVHYGVSQDLALPIMGRYEMELLSSSIVEPHQQHQQTQQLHQARLSFRIDHVTKTIPNVRLVFPLAQHDAGHRWIVEDKSRLQLTQGMLLLTKDKSSLVWDVRTDRPIELRGTLQMKLVPSKEVNQSSLGNGLFNVHRNCFVEVQFALNNCTFSGAIIDPSTVSTECNAKVTVSRHFQSGAYRIWNVLGDCPFEVKADRLSCVQEILTQTSEK